MVELNGYDNSEPTRSAPETAFNDFSPASSSPETTTLNPDDVVRSFYKSFSFPAATPAELPERVEGSLCGFCRLPESEDGVIVCDGCERGFHVDCAGILASEAVEVDDWMCSECLKYRKRANRRPKLRGAGQTSKMKKFQACTGEVRDEQSPDSRSGRNLSKVLTQSMEKDVCGPSRGRRKVSQMAKSSSYNRCLPPGVPISTRLPCNLVGDIFQVSEFLFRFSELLGLEMPLPYEMLEEHLVAASPSGSASDESKTITSCSLSNVHKSLLQVAIRELQIEVTEKGAKLGTLPINELTWPEFARRFALVFLYMDGNMKSVNMNSQRSSTITRCLQGDGGELCGSLCGAAEMHADAMLLAEATYRIFSSLRRDHDMLAIAEEDCEGNSSSENVALEVGVPKWAQVLEPVKKLPTNVGSRIRNCVREALDKGPPEWARKILERSISKEVYKGNASGPTKRAVLSVLVQACGEDSKHKPVAKKTRKKFVSISSIIMKQCQIVLREAAASDEKKAFCYLLGRKLDDGKDGEGILGSRSMVACPLDFRSIDLRLVAGAYDGSHDAFLEDVRQLWMNIRNAFADRPDMVQLAETLSSNFELLYERKVNALYRELVEYSKLDALSGEAKKKIEDLIVSTSVIPKAPWEKGVCRICVTDRDDNSVLLCDNCDAEYHTYCLNPPLARIPEGNWYCPSCIAYENMVEDAPTKPWITWKHKRNSHRKFTGSLLDMVARLSSTMEGREYWELSVDERTFLLKFLCDEILNSTLLREHLERCEKASSDLQQKLSRLSTEMKASQQKQDILDVEVGRARGNSRKFGGDVTKDELSVAVLSRNDKGYAKHNLSCDGRNNVNPPSVGIYQRETRSSVSNSKKICSVHNQVPVPADDIDRKETVPSRTLINDLEIQIEKLALRRRFLGSDSAGRFYWIVVNPSLQPSVIVNENKLLQRGEATIQGCSIRELERNICLSPKGSDAPCPVAHESSNDDFISSFWVSYQSDAEIRTVVDFLNDDDPGERQVRESILQWQKLRFLGDEQSEKQFNEGIRMPFSSTDDVLVSDCLMTKAACNLKVKYGYCVEPDTKSFLERHTRKRKMVVNDQMYRCDCLELVWPSRHHCSSCHRTFSTKVDYKVHSCRKCQESLGAPEKKNENGDSDMVNFGSAKDDTEGRGISITPGCESKNPSSLTQDRLVFPFTSEDIHSKFVKSCNNGSNGFPSFVSSVSPYLTDPAVKLDSAQEDSRCHVFQSQDDEPGSLSLENKIISGGGQSFTNRNSPGFCCRDPSDMLKDDKSAPGNSEPKDENPIPHYCEGVDIRQYCRIPESSLRPVGTNAYQIFRRLKINLLDMEAALPESALRSSKMHLERRWAWRDYVKSARTIYEMVQSCIVLEVSIKPEWLSNTWYHFSSLTAAAKIATLSSLAFRLYSLDAAINYEKTSVEPLQGKLQNGRKQSSRNSTEKCSKRRKLHKRRKDKET